MLLTSQFVQSCVLFFELSVQSCLQFYPEQGTETLQQFHDFLNEADYVIFGRFFKFFLAGSSVGT